MLPVCTFCADTCHLQWLWRGSLAPRLQPVYLELIISCNIIHHVTGIMIPRMGDSNSLRRHQPFPYTNINLHRKWNCNFAKTGSHCTLGVICLEVSAEIKNLSTYAVSITKQYLLLPLLIVYDVFEQCAEEPCIPGI